MWKLIIERKKEIILMSTDDRGRSMGLQRTAVYNRVQKTSDNLLDLEHAPGCLSFGLDCMQM